MDLANDFVGCEVPSTPAPETVIESENSFPTIDHLIPEPNFAKEDEE